MAVAWFIAPYKRVPDTPLPERYCAMDDFTPQIRADGGRWSETEIMGNAAIVKVSASDATLAVIAQATGFHRVPAAVSLDTLLSQLSSPQQRALRDKILSLGYTEAEITAALGSNLRTRTLGEVLRFMATKRLKPRYDATTDTIHIDGPVQACKPPEVVDAEV